MPDRWFGIYLLAMFSRKATALPALAGGVAGSVTSYVVAYHSPIGFMWPSTFGLAATLAVGWTLAWLIPPRHRQRMSSHSPSCTPT
ncbi:MAG: hypothetical protein DMG03_06630 [Acidobacteria bacterium]|nr:MAG: hypothetical protein DMG03_06630 [Acidobacteriota bacterium]